MKPVRCTRMPVAVRPPMSARPALALLALVALALAGSPARAADCTINATSAGFGNYDGTQNDAAISTISGSCSRGSNASRDPDMTGSTISLSTGLSGRYDVRQMANGADRLNYNLYTSAARSTVWGDDGAGTATVNALTTLPNGLFLRTNSTRSFSVTAYGRIPAGQDVTVGNYTDTITVTITY